MYKGYFLALLIIPAMILFGRFFDMSTATAAHGNFVGHFSGDQVVPAATSQGHGVVTFQLNNDGTELSYKLNVANVEHVQHLHLHLGKAGENGPPVAPLHAHHSTGQHGNSVHLEGVIQARDLMGPLAGSASLTPLLEAMASGRTYANVHTAAYPAGEVRGQVNIASAK